jgi:hypothetical protein
MSPHRGPAAALLLAALAAAAPAQAQGPDARVLPRGWVEVRGMGTFTNFDTRFGEGGSEALGARVEPQLQALVERLTLEPVDSLRTGLSTFFAATADDVENPVSPDEVALGSTTASLAGDLRHVPFTLSFGLTNRLTLDLTVPLERRGTSRVALFLADGTLGVNPAATANANVLGEIDEAYADLGRGSFLPVTGTPAGVELQRRVRALTGDTLNLPDRALSYADLLANAGLGTEEERVALGLPTARGQFQLGDVQVGARYQLFNTVPPAAARDSLGARGFRATVGARARLPTGSRSAVMFLTEVASESGHLGIGGDFMADAVLSRRWWVSFAAAADVRLAADVQRRAFTAGDPFPGDSAIRTLSRAPGPRFVTSLTPRWRLTQEISFAGHYAFELQGATEFSASDTLGEVVLGPIETSEGWSAHRFGIGGSYSTLEAYERGETPFPAEFWILYRNTVTGTGGAWDASSIEMGGRLMYPLFGRPRRARADSVPADTPLAPPQAPPAPPTRPVSPPTVTPADTTARPAVPPSEEERERQEERNWPRPAVPPVEERKER